MPQPASTSDGMLRSSTIYTASSSPGGRWKAPMLRTLGVSASNARPVDEALWSALNYFMILPRVGSDGSWRSYSGRSPCSRYRTICGASNNKWRRARWPPRKGNRPVVAARSLAGAMGGNHSNLRIYRVEQNLSVRKETHESRLLVWHGRVRVETVNDPTIVNPHDAIVK